MRKTSVLLLGGFLVAKCFASLIGERMLKPEMDLRNHRFFRYCLLFNELGEEKFG
jgi:hypothetical protein